MPFFRPRSASSESYTSTSSSITFSTETGPGAHAPLGALPRRAQRKSLFHIQNDDDTPPTPPTSSPPDTPPEPAHQDPVGIPFPSSFSAASGPLSPTTPSGPISPPAIVRSGSSSIILSNGKPLKPSLKSSSSSSISDTWAAQQQNAGNGSTNRSLHTRAQSMPSTPAFTPKNVHFQEDERLATVRVFRSTGRPRSVSTQNEDTETETEVEQPRHLSAYPFPAMGPLSSTSSSRTPLSNSPLAPIMDIDPSPMRTSPIPSPTASPYANVHLESISLPPSRPPVLRGAVLVRNISFEKRVSVRFTLDDWTTVSEVAATYASSLSAPHPVLPTASPATIGDIMATQPGSATTTTNQWDRFNFAIRLEDYEARLADRTLVLAAAYSAPGVGDWWDNNAGANYRVGFRPRAPPSSSSSSSAAIPATQPIRSKPSTSPFLNAAAPPPTAPRNTVNISSAFSSSNGGSGTGTPPRPVQLVRSVSTPSAPTARTLGRLALKHYAAPAPPALSMPERRPSPPSSSPERKQQTSPLKIFGGQFATQVENGADKVKKSGNGEEEVHVDEGFETGSDDDDEDKIATPTSASPVPRRAVKPGLHIPSSPAPTLAARGPFSPTRASPVPFGSATATAAVEGRGDATYAALIREWCFAQGDATGGGAATGVAAATTTTVGSGLGMPGKQNMLWVGMGG